MARDTSAGVVDAFLARKRRRGGKREGGRVRYATDGTELRIWGNKVAEWRSGGRIQVCDAGWRTVITKGVISAILDKSGSRCSVYQERGDWKIGCRPRAGEGPWRKVDWPGCMTFKPRGGAFAGACPTGTVFNRRLQQCMSVRGEMLGRPLGRR